MKKAILPLAAALFVITSCDVHDSTQTMGYPEYNLIVDTENSEQLAQTSYTGYEVLYNVTKNVIDVKVNDLVINNQKYSFETDTMGLRSKSISVEGGTTYNLCFSKPGQVKAGSCAKDLNGTFATCYWPGSNLLNPSVSVRERLDLSYTINDRYKVQTFWPVSMFRGYSMSSSEGQSLSTKESDYVASFDFQNNKASIYVYNAKLSDDQSKSFPKVICFQDVPVVFANQGFSVESSAPKTTILGVKDNVVTLVDSVGFAATDFSLKFISSDLTEAMISYKLDGHSVNFRGCSIIKSGY